MIHDIVSFTNRHAKTIGWLTAKLQCSEKELRAAIANGRKQGFLTEIVGENVFTRLAIATGPLIIIGNKKPGRHHIALYSDTHWGSKHSLEKAQLEFLRMAWKKGCRTVVAPGDLTDGVKPLLVPEQRYTGADEQIAEGTEIWRKAPPFQVVSCTGNHDGYTSHAVGSDIGRVIEQRMQAEGVEWYHSGTCLGQAVVNGARVQLWHPHGAASTTNAVRRTLNARAEKLEVPVDLIVSGHYHHYAAVHAYQEDVFCVGAATFQVKKYEFANRISGGWNVGGAIISFTADRKGRAHEFSSKFYPAFQG